MMNQGTDKSVEVIKKAFESHGQKLQFQTGQSLVSVDYLPGQVLLIEKGIARLIITDNNRLTTLNKLKPGDLIGVSSLLRGESCEEVRAAENLVAWSMSDEKFKEIYNLEKDIAIFCQNFVWDGEIISIIKSFIKETPGDIKFNIRDCVKVLKATAQVVSPKESEVEEALKQGKRLFLCSNSSKQDLGFEITSSEIIQELTTPDGEYPLRIISLSSQQIHNLFDSGNKRISTLLHDAVNKKDPKPIPLGPNQPPVSDLEGYKLSDEFIVRGEGPLMETMACLQMLAKLLNFPFRRDALEKLLKERIRKGILPTLQFCGHILSSLGLQVAVSKITPQVALRIKTPSIILWKKGFAVITRSNQKGITIASPREGFVEIGPNQLEDAFPEETELLLVERSIITPEKAFGPSWFWPAISNYKGVLIQILIAGFVVQLFALANPLLIQVIIDKVITQRSLETLQILGIALLLVTLFEGVLGTLKTFLLSETTNRIDQRLGAEVIDHLLRLPLCYFDKRPVGEVSSRINELEKIRTFLTGQAFTTLLDAVFSIIYLIVMLFYSWILTLLSLLVLPIQIGLTLIGTPLFRRQFRNAAEENAKTQSHLVEVLTAMQTVKAQHVEMISRLKWQKLYGNYINRSFEKTISRTLLGQISQVLQKTSQLLVLWVGATMVLKGELSLGQLIAFRIISGYVTQPLLRISTLWQSIQELKISFERLADVIDTPQETSEMDKEKIQLPPIQGDVVFENINFSFSTNGKPILRNINFSVNAGTFVGIAGKSGSGKSTLMKLLPLLYSPEEGRIIVDGFDIQKVALYSLRRQIGIIPQEPLLFSGSVSENISLNQPEASNEDIIKAAKIANAHDFIMELPNGYSSSVGERGSLLSGGQRQRIAIARTLLDNPKILVMDEATSALDYESERKVCDNLRKELNECTVFFITHRLSTIKQANIIMMMNQGSIEEIGSHETLIEKRGRYYALYQQQESS